MPSIMALLYMLELYINEKLLVSCCQQQNDLIISLFTKDIFLEAYISH